MKTANQILSEIKAATGIVVKGEASEKFTDHAKVQRWAEIAIEQITIKDVERIMQETDEPDAAFVVDCFLSSIQMTGYTLSFSLA